MKTYPRVLTTSTGSQFSVMVLFIGLITAVAWMMTVSSPKRNTRPLADPASDLTTTSRYVLPTSHIPGQAVSYPLPSETEQRIWQKLQQPVSVDWKKVPLQELASLLQRLVGAPVILNEQTLMEEGIPVDFPISGTFQNVRLETALGLCLSVVNLTWYVEDHALMLTTEIHAEEHICKRIYPVGDLIPDRKAKHQLFHIIHEFTSGYWRGYDGIGGELITIDDGSSLIVFQTHHVQREIARLLHSLRLANSFQPEDALRKQEAVACYPAPSEREKQIKSALQQPVTLAWNPRPFDEIIQQISTVIDGHVIINMDQLSEVDRIRPGEPAIGSAVNSPLGPVFRQALFRLGLEYYIADDMLTVASRDHKPEKKTPRFYPVEDVLGPDQSYQNFADQIFHVTDWRTSGPEDTGEIYPAPAFNCLVIWTIPQVHQEIAELFHNMRLAQAHVK